MPIESNAFITDCLKLSIVVRVGCISPDATLARYSVTASLSNVSWFFVLRPFTNSAIPLSLSANSAIVFKPVVLVAITSSTIGCITSCNNVTFACVGSKSLRASKLIWAVFVVSSYLPPILAATFSVISLADILAKFLLLL